MVRRVPRIEVREIPIERVIQAGQAASYSRKEKHRRLLQVPKKIVQEVETPVYRPVPHLVQGLCHLGIFRDSLLCFGTFSPRTSALMRGQATGGKGNSHTKAIYTDTGGREAGGL